MGDRSTELVTYLPASLLRALAARPSATLPWCHEVDGTMVMADLSGLHGALRAAGEARRRGRRAADRRHQLVLREDAEDGVPLRRRHADLRRRRDPAAVRRGGARRRAPWPRRWRCSSRSTARQPSTPATARSRSACPSAPTATRSCWARPGSPDERAHLFVLGRGAETTALAEAQAERGQLAVSPSTKKLLSGRVKTARAGDFWRVDEFAGEGVRHGAGRTCQPRSDRPPRNAPSPEGRTCGCSPRSCRPTRGPTAKGEEAGSSTSPSTGAR